MTSKRNTMGSAVLAFDYPPDGSPIFPCVDCLAWHVEVVQTPEEGVLVREWHAVGCRVWEPEDDGIVEP